jgi:hypothetical protein
MVVVKSMEGRKEIYWEEIMEGGENWWSNRGEGVLRLFNGGDGFG